MPAEVCTINWDFIQALEGFRTSGYVPDQGNSGVTIGAGFDIGQHDKASLYQFGFSIALLNKLRPYLGFTGESAKELLTRVPLKLSSAEAEEMDAGVRKAYAKAVEDEYSLNSDYTFSFLDTPKQTVIVSVGFQYGSLKTKCPKFFHCVTGGMWQAAVTELRNFEDDYSERRNKEADYLASSIDQKQLQGN